MQSSIFDTAWEFEWMVVFRRVPVMPQIGIEAAAEFKMLKRVINMEEYIFDWFFLLFFVFFSDLP